MDRAVDLVPLEPRPLQRLVCFARRIVSTSPQLLSPSPAMSVMLETSLGELVIDLETERCPRTCENFLKLCKIKYYALNAFFNGASDCVPPEA